MAKKVSQKLQDTKEVWITDFDRYLFGQGKNFKIYEKFGAHPCVHNGVKGMHFAVWAPHAKSVSVASDRNNWDVNVNVLTRLPECGIFEGFIPEMGFGEVYKYAITTASNEVIYKADPYAFSAEKRPNNASKTADISSFVWKDDKWMANRASQDTFQSPMSIYECHLGSWKKEVTETDEDGFLNYRKLAKELVDYVGWMGYTHVELIGIAEHPFDGSWGYQVTGYYAPTSRYGTPEDFQWMINYLHKHNIGVILDWVPAHFPRDAFGLANFDGEALYEYADPRRGEHPDWGTKIFDFGKNEVRNFLMSNALYWYDEYHIDGLRVDAVASMLYLNYGRQQHEFIFNKYGDEGNLEAISFFQELNTMIKDRNDGTIMIAEESTAWPKVTGDPKDQGLGFTYKWNMGWMHDFLNYMQLVPYFRKNAHNQMTFGMSYATSEKFILVLSHDEVVHLKKSMIEKMPGDTETKFANLKAGYLFMFGHAGKKLLFMGQDFGQYHEWDEKVQLNWELCDEPNNHALMLFMRDLLHLYKKYPAMNKLDSSWEGFQWVNADDRDRSIFSFIRRDGTGKNSLLFVVNFTPVAREDYMVGVPNKGRYTLLLNENGELEEKKMFTAVKGECDGQPYHVSYPLPGFGCAIFKFNENKK